MTVRITVNVQYHYDVSEEDLEKFYFTTDPFVAAVIDEGNLQKMPYTIAEDLDYNAKGLIITAKGERLPDVLPSA